MRIPYLKPLRIIRLPPSAVLALLYLGLILLGMLLLKLPFATTQPLAWQDALFTATSAVTITGLGVVDTGAHFTTWGQGIIALLLELGGIGVMTFTVLVLSMLGFQIGTAQHAFLREDLNQTSINSLMKLTWIIFKIVISCQAVGALILSVVFIPELGWGKGFWYATFHSISAFTNGGFALYSNSMSPFVDNLIINITIPILVILGGIGYSVITDVWKQRRWHAFSLHTKLMLVGTAILLVVSVSAFALLEWTNPKTLGALDSPSAKFGASWFQMVMSRSGGLNSIDLAGMHESTTLLFIMLMLIGGGSTSMAGGLKVTTFIVLILSAIAFFKRQRWIHVFGRSIREDQIQKVLALTVTTLILLMLAVFLLTLDSDGQILALFFEATSALATVGASLGITASLSDFERSIIMLLMFMGRVGPLSLGIFLAMNTTPKVRYPKGQIYFG
ncbi:TrkH family potassium uptake protein [Thiofilum flexile]|uniref:TrkH family potassium uptake protein n=1 Tax=Thiofilum flexile TaxID=125627 RepID=UPI000364077C|nr:potassium transporter TrkG [Thiofilum flexile]